MARKIVWSDEDIQCSECEAIFQVIWHRAADIDGVEYCPFCGVEFDERD